MLDQETREYVSRIVATALQFQAAEEHKQISERQIREVEVVVPEHLEAHDLARYALQQLKVEKKHIEEAIRAIEKPSPAAIQAAYDELGVKKTVQYYESIYPSLLRDFANALVLHLRSTDPVNKYSRSRPVFHSVHVTVRPLKGKFLFIKEWGELILLFRVVADGAHVTCFIEHPEYTVRCKSVLAEYKTKFEQKGFQFSYYADNHPA